MVGCDDGCFVGEAVGLVLEGRNEGLNVGDDDGFTLGLLVGRALGLILGRALGLILGRALGLFEGKLDGFQLGFDEGNIVGVPVTGANEGDESGKVTGEKPQRF